MKIIKPYVEICDTIDGDAILKKIEKCGRVCYKSEGKVYDGSAEKFVKNVIKRGHESVLEHVSITLKFVVDRAVSHEIVRHRLASYSQESTRDCNYIKEDFGSEITFILPYFFEGSVTYDVWARAMQRCEDAYFDLLNIGAKPEEARSVLPHSLKTEVVMTMNLRELRNFLRLRTADAAHPQMREVARPLLGTLKELIPVVFDYIWF